MEYGSFYGGRRGASFIIEKSFPSIKAMADAFAQGNSYDGVSYGGYVLIDTKNKNNPDNGKLYKRGINYNDTTTSDYFIEDSNDSSILIHYDGRNNSYPKVQLHGAEYIGTISGPAGPAPSLVVESYDAAKQKYDNQPNNRIKMLGTATVNNQNLIPGFERTSSGQVYNDGINWVSVTLRDDVNNQSIVYLGLQIPYLVNEFTVSSTYGNSNVSIVRTDTENGNEQHPFYRKWNINIPQNVKGDAIRNLRVMVPTQDNIIDEPDCIYDITVNQNGTITTSPKYSTATADDIVNQRQILVYDSWDFSQSLQGTKKIFYLGEYNQIEDVSLATDGTLTIDFTYGNTLVYNKLIKWIDNISITEGTLTIDYNNNTPSLSQDLNIIKNIEITEDGQLRIIYHHSPTDRVETITTETNFIKWIKDIELENDGTMTVTYNNDDSEVLNTLKWISGISLNSQGIVTVTYNTKENNENIIEIINQSNAIRWIESAYLETRQGEDDPIGTLKITYNTGGQFTTRLKWPTDLSLSPTGELSASYTDGNTEIINSENPIQYITNLSLSQEGQLIAFYNTLDENSISENPVYKTIIVNENQPIQYVKNINYSDDGFFEIVYNTLEENQTTGQIANKTIIVNEENPVQYVQDLSYSSDTGFLEVVYNTTQVDQISEETFNKTNIINENQPIQYVQGISYLENGYLEAIYNTKRLDSNQGSDVPTNKTAILNENSPIQYIKSLSLSSDGLLEATYNTGEEDGEGLFINKTEIINENAPIQFVTDFLLSSDGYLEAIYNIEDLSSDDGLKHNTINLDNPISYPVSIEVVNGGYIQITYNTKDEQDSSSYKQQIINRDSPIKYIIDMQLLGNGYIQVTYNTYTIDDQTNQRVYDTQIINEYNSQDPESEDLRFKWVTSTVLTQDGRLINYYNTGQQVELMNNIKLPQDLVFNNNTGFLSTRYNGDLQDTNINTTPIRWINDIQIDEYGNVNITNNLGQQSSLSTQLSWIQNIELSNNGQLTFTYNNLLEEGPQHRVYEPIQKIKWIENLEINKATEVFSIKYNTDNSPIVLANNVKWIDLLSFNEYGDFKIKMSNSDNYLVDTTIVWPTNIQIQNNGTFNVELNTGDTISQNNLVQWLDSISYDDSEGLKIKLNTESTERVLHSAFNYIKDTMIGGDHHLLLLYSDQTKAAELAESQKRIINNEIWTDLGSIYQYSGILVGLRIDTASGDDVAELEDVEEAINYLTEYYPQGLTGDVAGKIVIIGSDQTLQKFYAYNYGDSDSTTGAISEPGWFLLGSLSQNTSMCVGRADSNGDPTNQQTRSEIQALSTGGIWFMTEDWG